MCAQLRSLLQVIGDIATAVRYLINTTRPINQLPPEVLGYIFSFIPTPRKHPILDTATTNVQDVIPLLPALSVCRRWREVAHGASFLWSTVISICDIPLPQDYLHLNPAGPIRVVSDGGRSRSPAWLLGLLRAQGARVRELYVVLDDVSKEDFSAFQQLSLPALERCTIRVNGYRYDDYSNAPLHPMAIFPNSNALRALRIRMVHFVPITAFPALTTLHLATVQGVLRLIDLLNFLAGTPLLQDLQLNDIYSFSLAAIDLSGWKHGRVRIKDLKRLVMAEDTDIGAPGLRRSEQQMNIIADYQRGLLSSLSIPLACALAIGNVKGTALVADLLDQLWPSSSAQRCITQARIMPHSDSNTSTFPNAYRLAVVKPSSKCLQE